MRLDIFLKMFDVFASASVVLYGSMFKKYGYDLNPCDNSIDLTKYAVVGVFVDESDCLGLKVVFE